MGAPSGQGEGWEDTARGLRRRNHCFEQQQSYSMAKPKLTPILCKEEVQNSGVYLIDRNIPDLFPIVVLTSVSCST